MVALLSGRGSQRRASHPDGWHLRLAVHPLRRPRIVTHTRHTRPGPGISGGHPSGLDRGSQQVEANDVWGAGFIVVVTLRRDRGSQPPGRHRPLCWTAGRVAVTVRGGRGSQPHRLAVGAGQHAPWRSPFGAAEDRNFHTGRTSPIITAVVVRSPFGVTEDRNTTTVNAVRPTSMWWSPFGATGDRNIPAIGRHPAGTPVAVAFGGDRGSQLPRHHPQAARRVEWRLPFGVAEGRNGISTSERIWTAQRRSSFGATATQHTRRQSVRYRVVSNWYSMRSHGFFRWCQGGHPCGSRTQRKSFGGHSWVVACGRTSMSHRQGISPVLGC